MNNNTHPKTMYQKIWDSHVVAKINNELSLIYIDKHFIHEVTSPQAFSSLRNKNLTVRRGDLTYATCDHNVSTTGQNNISDPLSKLQVETLERNCRDFDIELFGLNSNNQGIVHVIGPELGITQPGNVIVCGDSHTSTHGAFGILAFGIGTTEVEQVLASQCLLASQMKTMEIRINGKLGKGVSAKDVILTILAKIGTKGGTGFCIEYTGEVIKNMDMESRMTICNMSIEGGARAGMIAPDETTFNYLKGRKFVPSGNDFDRAVTKWKKLKSDAGAKYNKNVVINGKTIEPLITYGTDQSTGIGVIQKIPKPNELPENNQIETLKKALFYMNLKPGMKLEGFPIDYVFIGSCTNARITDLRDAAKIVKGKKVKGNIVALVVPGSRSVKIQAEKEGLDRIFTDAGFQWRWPGCSACIAMSEDKIPSGKYCVSTSNRNFEGRQGPGARTFLASPITAAACAIEGRITDVRKYL
jgi:3-isopropylmalate/(R)-2-methylmalate dehydratase large subunit